MGKFIRVAIFFFIVTPVFAQVQAFKANSYDTPEAAASALASDGVPVALVPSYVKQENTTRSWEMMSWVTISSPWEWEYGNACLLQEGTAAMPIFGAGGPCFSAGLAEPTTETYSSFSAAYAAFMNKTPLQRHSCIIVREPGQQAFTWLAGRRYWLTCQNSSFAISC